MSFFNELKRRNVFRVGIAYAVASWVLLQIVDLVLENISAPAWVMQVFMLALAIGFPIAVIMAWAFEMTPDGIKREADIDRNESITPQTGRKLDRMIIAFLALAVVFLVIDPFGQDADNEGSESNSLDTSPQTGQVAVENLTLTPENTGQRAQREKSVAVLPFAFRSNKPEDEFFAEGMHDDLLTQLAKIGSLKVISRTSVMEYKDTTKKIPQIAAELGVATIVEGGVQRSGSRIRINAQLIDAQTDQHLWAETFNRELTAENLFDIQTEIARAIAQALQAALSPEEEVRINRALTSNLEAWKSYQRAIGLRQAITIDGMKAGVAEINLALELDPNFAAAWGLKAILLLQQYWFYDTNRATRDAAWDAIERGRAIDPTLAQLDIAEGYYYYWGFRDYAKALPLMQRASAALPNSARVHQARSYVLRRMGDWGNTLAALRRARELDPRNRVNHTDIGATLTYLHRFHEANQAFSGASAIDPNNPNTLWQIAYLHLLESGDIKNYARLNHLFIAPNPDAQLNTWRSSLYLGNFDAALQDVVDWQGRFLDTKDYRVTRPLLSGLTHLYAGDTETAAPLLRAANQEFESLLQKQPENYAINRSLCFITGGLGELTEARKYCKNSLQTAPKDALFSGGVKFNAAAGLALAGDAQGSVKLLKAMLDSGVGPTIYPIIYHPAFDGIRDDPTYLKLLDEYGPQTHE